MRADLRALVRRRPTLVRRLTGRARMLPGFVVIGAQRCGTTALYGALVRHPDVGRARRKEVHFFDRHWGRGLGWYRAQFPLRGRAALTGEATPYYLFHPLAPERAARSLPQARLIALLRNPVDRAWSHHQHSRRLGLEPLGFEEALDREAERLSGEEARLREDPRYRSLAHERYSYLARGAYADQLEAWLRAFPAQRLLVLLSEDLFRDPEGTFPRVLGFLGLDPGRWPPGSYAAPAERSPRSAMRPGTRERLVAHFAPHNGRLAAMLGREPGWDR